MDDRMMPQQHRPRSRDRSDQRRPTFQILNAVQPRTRTQAKRDFGHYGLHSPTDHPHSEGEYHDRDIETTGPSAHLQKSFIGVHTIGNKSVESVASSYRGPACNFTTNFRPIKNNLDNIPNERYQRPQSFSPEEVPNRSGPGRPRSQSPQDRVVMDEPSDLVVWNASKKASRSNLLCPLTDSEFRNICVKDTKTIMRAVAPRQRSNSVPGVHHYNANHRQNSPNNPPALEPRNSVLFNVENLCREAAELLDDFAPPPMSPSQVSPSSSVASASTSYSLQISLVTQQLEEIQQAQNDVLKHLGEEISKVTVENEKLKQEVEHVRDQNEGLLKVVHDTTDELERMKHIFRTRGLSHPHVETKNKSRQEEPEEKAPEHSSALPPQSPHYQQQQQRHHNQRSTNKHQQSRHGGKRDSVNSNGSNSNRKSPMGDGDPAMAHLLTDIHESEESSYMKHSAEESGNKSPKRSKNKPRIENNAEDEQDVNVTVEDNNDDNASYRSVDSQNTKSSSRKSRGEHQHRHSHHHSSYDNTSHNHEHRRRSRSRSKEKHKSPRSSNCYEQDEKKIRQLSKPVYNEDCNDNIELKDDSGGGCFRVFTCCWSSSSARSRTDSVDDMILRGCPE